MRAVLDPSLSVLRFLTKNELQVVRIVFCIGSYWMFLLSWLQTWIVPMTLFGYTSPFLALMNLIILVWRLRPSDAVILFFSVVGTVINYVVLHEFANP